MKKFYKYALLFAAACAIGGCNLTDDEDDVVVEEPTISDFGIPLDWTADANPSISGDSNITIPNMSAPILEEGTEGTVMRFSLTGIKTADNTWLQLYGTGDSQQNVWIEIDGKPKGFVIVNGDELSRAVDISKALADVVFLVDNSGSMSEEADAVANEILSWSAKLAGTMDVRFGCVGYGDSTDGIDGALNITEVDNLAKFLNRTTGTGRTYGFSGADAAELYALAQSSTYYNGAYNECGGLALRFADENFAFREGANRIYVNLTDEPNQPYGIERWSVETLNTEAAIYDWNTARGTIHTVFSEDPNYYEYWGWMDLLAEKPWLMSDYTGGTTIYARSDFSDVTLDGLDVTGAILNSYIVRLNVTPDLAYGSHTVKITILTPDGQAQGEKIFENVTFLL